MARTDIQKAAHTTTTVCTIREVPYSPRNVKIFAQWMAPSVAELVDDLMPCRNETGERSQDEGDLSGDVANLAEKEAQGSQRPQKRLHAGGSGKGA